MCDRWQLRILMGRDFRTEGVEKMIGKDGKVAVVGMGYVGLPLALAFAKKRQVVGFDTNEEKIAKYLRGEDPTGEVGGQAILTSTMRFTACANALKEADYIIVAVPTPINGDKTPDLNPVIGASKIVGQYLKKSAIVIFESTVYPGVTEDICVPILEKASGLTCGKDFFVGYSPERINPGDKKHRLSNIVKVVSGMNQETLDKVANLYEEIIESGVHRAESIKVAEAAKLLENSQRDINIAFMNECAMVLERMNIPSHEVIKAMNTKWNALGFYPGLVGGHCIGVDPYYFIYQAEQLGYHSQIIAAGRKVNDDMPIYVAEMIIKRMVLADIRVKEAKIYFMGVTFKENCPDIRNSKTKAIITELEKYDMNVKLCDPLADPKEVRQVFGKELVAIDEIKAADCLVFTVAHEAFKNLSIDSMRDMYGVKEKALLIDIRNMFDAKKMIEHGLIYWSL